MQKPWNKHITRNGISRYVAAEKQRWIESRDYFMHCMFLKQMSYPERLQQNLYMNWMATRYFNQINSCMMFPPSKLSPPYFCPQSFQFPPSRRAMNYGMFSDNRQRHRPTNTRYIRNDHITNIKDWRRECSDARPQTYQAEHDLNLPNTSFPRVNKDISNDRNVERTRGRQLRSTNWTHKESQSNDATITEQDKDEHNGPFYINMYDAKHRPYNYTIRDRYAELQWNAPTLRNEEKNSHAQLTDERYFLSTSSEETLSNRKEYSFQSQNNGIPLATVKETSVRNTRKTHETSWATQMEEDNDVMEISVANTIEPWNCEEQQSIVDMLRKEDLNHERQMMQDYSPLKNLNQGKGDFSSPPVVYEDFSRGDHKGTSEESLSSSGDNIIVIVPSDAFTKSLKVFKDMQSDCNTITAHVSKTSEIKTGVHKLTVESESSELIKPEDWGKYCVGWSTDNDEEEKTESGSIMNLSPTSTLSESLSDELQRKLRIEAGNEVMAGYSETNEQVASFNVNVPEFHYFGILESTNVEQVVNAQASKPSIADKENFESFSSQFETGNEFIRSFGSTNISDYQKSYHTRQIFPTQNFCAPVDSIERNDDSRNNVFNVGNTMKLNNVHYDPQQSMISNQSTKIREEHYNSHERCDNVSPRCRSFLRYPTLTINHDCCPQLINAYVDGKIHPSYGNVYQNCPSVSETTNSSINEENFSSSINNEKNINASNFLKLILGISSEITEGNNFSINPSNIKQYNSEIVNDKLSDPIAIPSNSSTKILKCNTIASFQPKKSSPVAENRLINKVQHAPNSSPESQDLNRNTDFKSKTSKRSCKCDKSTSAKIKAGTGKNPENLEFNLDLSRKFNLKNARQHENKSRSETSGVSSLSNTNFETTSLNKPRTKKTRKSYKEGKGNISISEQPSIKQYAVTLASTASKTIQKKDSSTENVTLKDKYSSQNQPNSIIGEHNISSADLELKLLKKNMVMNGTKNAKSIKCKLPQKLNISWRKQIENNNNTTSDHSNANKVGKTNAEIAAEYQARRKAKLYHERKINRIKSGKTMQQEITGVSFKVNCANIANNRKTEPVEKQDNLPETKVIENTRTENKLNRKKRYDRKVHNYVIISRTRTEEENNDINIDCTNCENNVNFHCAISTSTRNEVQAIEHKEDHQQQRNCNQHLNNNNFKKRELRCYGPSTQKMVHSAQTMIPCSTPNSYLPPPFSMPNPAIPWIMENNSNLLSQRLVRDLLKVSRIFNESMLNSSSPIHRNSLLQRSSFQFNAFRNINLNPVFRRHPAIFKSEHVHNYSPDFSLKFYEYLYHLWRRYYPFRVRTALSCEHQLDKRVLFASWLHHMLSTSDLKVNER